MRRRSSLVTYTHIGLDELKGQLLEMGICEVLIPLTDSPSSEVQGNSAAALGNLSSKGESFSSITSCLRSHTRSLDGRTTSDDYSAFNDVWDKPNGGMHKYLYRFLTSLDATFQHIAVWTIVQLLESGGQCLLLFRFARKLAHVKCRSPAHQQHPQLDQSYSQYQATRYDSDLDPYVVNRRHPEVARLTSLLPGYRNGRGPGRDTATRAPHPRVHGRRPGKCHDPQRTSVAKTGWIPDRQPSGEHDGSRPRRAPPERTRGVLEQLEALKPSRRRLGEVPVGVWVRLGWYLSRTCSLCISSSCVSTALFPGLGQYFLFVYYRNSSLLALFFVAQLRYVFRFRHSHASRVCI